VRAPGVVYLVALCPTRSLGCAARILKQESEEDELFGENRETDDVWYEPRLQEKWVWREMGEELSTERGRQICRCPQAIVEPVGCVGGGSADHAEAARPGGGGQQLVVGRHDER
jgi:hypothetical protein